jgi:hypothetical protein
MPGIDATAGTLTVPIWLAGAGSAVLLVAILVAVKRAGGVALVSSLFRVGVIAAFVLGAWLYVDRGGAKNADNTDRRALDDRKTALITGAIAPGSALSCLDEMAGEAVATACEKSVFASPEAVAAAVKYVAAQLELLKDGTAYAMQDSAYTTELAPLRAAIELDRFGLVAHVLGDHEGCTAERCDAVATFHDSSHVMANLRDHTFDEEVKRYTVSWNAPHLADGVVAAVGPPVSLPSATGPGTVAPKYDFPSSKSIPAVSIMAPEGPPPKDSARDAAPGRDVMPQAMPAPPASREAAVTPPADPNAGATPNAATAAPPGTPVPPRRPPQVRAPAPPRAAAAATDPADAAPPRQSPSAPR